MIRFIALFMCFAHIALAQTRTIGLFLVSEDASLNKSTLTTWNNGAGFIMNKGSPDVAADFNRVKLSKALKYKKYNSPDACVRSDGCVAKAAVSLGLDGIMIALLIPTGEEKYEIEYRYVSADETQKPIINHPSYKVSNMFEEIASAVAGAASEMMVEKKGTLVLSRMPASMRVTLNTIKVASDTIQLKVGKYQLEATSEGYLTFRKTIEIVRGEVLRETIVLEQQAVARSDDLTEKFPRRAMVEMGTEIDISTPMSQRTKYKIGAWTTTGIAIASFATATVFMVKGYEVLDKAETCSQEFCPDFIGESYLDAQDDMKTYNYTANVMWGVGGAAAISAVTLWVLSAYADDETLPISIVPTHDGGMIFGTF